MGGRGGPCYDWHSLQVTHMTNFFQFFYKKENLCLLLLIIMPTLLGICYVEDLTLPLLHIPAWKIQFLGLSVNQILPRCKGWCKLHVRALLLPMLMGYATPIGLCG